MAVAVDRRASLLRVARISWFVPVAVAIWVLVQRWNQPHLGRNIALLTLALVPITAHDLYAARVSWLRDIPEAVLSLPIVLVVLVLAWQPVASDFAPFLLVLVTARSTLKGRYRDGIAVLLASAAVMISVDAASRFSGSINWVLGLGLAWIGACSVRSMSRLIDELMIAQADLAERAAADERRRIAHEIHDVIAHSLSVAALHITGARMAIGRDPDEAMRALQQAERLARDSLAQVRSAIGVLSPSTEGIAPALPTAVDIPTLIKEFTDAGVSVVLDVRGDVAALSPTLGLTLYRVTQESLSNVIRHAPGASASVGIRASAQLVSLSVRNSVVNSATVVTGGRGISGMRERVAAHGGTLDAGTTDGQWFVRLTVPIEVSCP